MLPPVIENFVLQVEYNALRSFSNLIVATSKYYKIIYYILQNFRVTMRKYRIIISL